MTKKLTSTISSKNTPHHKNLSSLNPFMKTASNIANHIPSKASLSYLIGMNPHNKKAIFPGNIKVRKKREL